MNEVVVSFPYPIWQVLIGQDAEAILMKGDSGFWFSAVRNGQVNFQIALPKWANLLFMTSGYILVGYYPDPRIPEIKGIQCFDVHSGACIWQSEQAIPTAFYENGVEALIENRPFFLSVQTGQITSQHPIIQPDACQYPELFLPEDTHYTDVKAFFEKRTNFKIEGSISYLQTDDYLITYSSDGYLLIADSQGQKIFSKKYTKGNFVLRENRLHIILEDKILYFSL